MIRPSGLAREARHEQMFREKFATNPMVEKREIVLIDLGMEQIEEVLQRELQ